MSEKVKLPREVAEAIELCRSNPFNTNLYLVINSYIKEYEGSFRYTNFDNIVKAIVNGYEVEETPEERVRKMFRIACEEDSSHSLNHPIQKYWEGRRMAIIDTLNELNIKIEGVNA